VPCWRKITRHQAIRLDLETIISLLTDAKESAEDEDKAGGLAYLVFICSEALELLDRPPPRAADRGHRPYAVTVVDREQRGIPSARVSAVASGRWFSGRLKPVTAHSVCALPLG
jgi:hypothetical protein